MSYLRMRNDLLDTFNQNNFEKVWRAGEKNKQSYERNQHINTLAYNYPNNYNLNIVINYPGYKTYVKSNGDLVYDYKVSLNAIPISHVNIIVDLYNKSVQSDIACELLSKFIRELAIKGDEIDLQGYIKLNDFNFATPSQDLLDYVNQAHVRLSKNYLIEGNYNWNYTIEELSTIIPLIALQEDINYPIPHYQGRRMPFYRYLEANYCAIQNSAHSLNEVIERALSHGRPALWDYIDYEDITKLTV